MNTTFLMTLDQRVHLLVVCLLLAYQSTGQVNPQPVDTVNIYKDKTGVPFRIYMRHWFFGYGLSNSYSWKTRDVNRQDSLVIEPHPPSYFKVYDKKDRLLLEGFSDDLGTEFTGDVKFFYKNGAPKNIEHWNNTFLDTTCSNIAISMNDAPGPEGTWTTFRKNGTTKKQQQYLVEVYQCKPLQYCEVKQVNRYKRSGQAKPMRVKKQLCWSDQEEKAGE